MAFIVVERTFPEPVDFDALQAVEDGAADCLNAHGVTFVRTFFSRDQLRMICLYEAPDAEAVRAAQRQAGLPFDRAWTAERLPGDREGYDS